ncbi:Rossmann-like and DUF2520 domain-containing protein [Paratractidigestivibacter sp.]|uniref:Rossmann-like and DUF2520 domain-containing protein n=1 Tax=Paratractidigestivibacter sp. TaxID=2847316 RepID=UPI002AC938C7|nr:Rossmann-like and DUF2520 domain-containing protein [Paratractidigestivibacter sp.]
MTRVGFIGAGKVGCSLARYLREGGAELAGFFSRTPSHAQEAADFAGGQAYSDEAKLVAASDVVFITTPDGQLAEVAAKLAATLGDNADGKVFAHCSGALSSDVLAPLREAGASVCSAHPLYAVSSRFDCWQELSRAWFTLEGDAAATAAVEALLASCGNHVAHIAASEKPRYHAAAVMASNLVVGLYQMAADELVTCGFAPNDAQAALAPLFLGNAEHIAAAGTRASLTGPAARGDKATIDAHLSCLSGDAREVYRQLTEVLYRIASL